MDAQLERRAGNDRRRSFLGVLDRRKSFGESEDRQLNGDADDFENSDGNELDSDRAITGNYWGAGEEIPPIE